MLKAQDHQRGNQITEWDHDVEQKIYEDIQQEIAHIAELQAQMLAAGKQLGGAGGLQNPMYTMIDNSKRYVLVAEDNQMISMILEQTLKSINYVPILAENGKVAVEKFSSFMKEGLLFDLILMDILMPEMGGYESTQLIRKTESEYNLAEHERHYICGFSAEVNEQIVQKCKTCGMNDCVSKPMTKDRLESMLNEVRRETNLASAGISQGNIVDDMPSKNIIDNKDLTILPGYSRLHRNGSTFMKR